MYTAEEKTFFLEHGYLHAKGVVEGEHLELLRREFDRIWALEKPRVNQHKLLKYPVFIDLIEHPPIVDRHRAIFGAQTQLLQYDFLRQGPKSESAERGWHRDFVFPGDRPISINTILYLDDMTEEVGPTRVVPGSHRGEALPVARDQPHRDEIAVCAAAGDAAFINGAIWHTGGRNKGEGLRRGVYLYFGYWWLKRYESEQVIPWQATENASAARLELLGIKMPDRDIHMYRPDAGFV